MPLSASCDRLKKIVKKLFLSLQIYRYIEFVLKGFSEERERAAQMSLTPKVQTRLVFG